MAHTFIDPATEIVKITGGVGVPWTNRERPCINYWYRTRDTERDYWKIMKDFHSPETNKTYYKIVEYYNGDILYAGKSLAVIRQLIRDNTFRMVI